MRALLYPAVPPGGCELKYRLDASDGTMSSADDMTLLSPDAEKISV